MVGEQQVRELVQVQRQQVLVRLQGGQQAQAQAQEPVREEPLLAQRWHRRSPRQQWQASSWNHASTVR